MPVKMYEKAITAMPALPLISQVKLELPFTSGTACPLLAMTPAMIKWTIMHAMAPTRRRIRRPTRSMMGSITPVVTRKITYWMADDQRVVFPVWLVSNGDYPWAVAL